MFIQQQIETVHVENVMAKTRSGIYISPHDQMSTWVGYFSPLNPISLQDCPRKHNHALVHNEDEIQDYLYSLILILPEFNTVVIKYMHIKDHFKVLSGITVQSNLKF